MALKEIPLRSEGSGEQLSFKAFELADCVRDLLQTVERRTSGNQFTLHYSWTYATNSSV